jgi:hypothetical protein
MIENTIKVKDRMNDFLIGEGIDPLEFFSVEIKNPLSHAEPMSKTQNLGALNGSCTLELK